MTQATFIEWQSSKTVDHEMAGHGEDYQQHVWQQKDIHHQPPGVIPWNGFIVECDELLTICYKNPYNTKSS